MQIIAFLLLVLAVMLLLSAKKESVEPRVKWTISGAFLVLIVVAFVYETQFAKKRVSDMELVNNFEQGKILICQEYVVDNKHYNYENGTQSFIAKKEFKELSGLILPLSSCKVNGK